MSGLEQLKWSVIALGCLMLSTVTVHSQQLEAPSLPTGLLSASPSSSTTPMPSGASASDDGESDRPKEEPAGNSVSQNPSAVLSASQILTILQSRPELVVDLKQVMADYLQQGGTAVQVDSITDDMLYQGISSNAGLREAISVWLRARGYLDDLDLEGLSSIGPQGVDDTTRSPTISGPGTAASSKGTGLPGTVALDSGRLETPTSDVNQKKDSPASRNDIGRSSQNKSDRNSGNATEIIHQATPYNLQSLRDLYSQVPEQTSKLRRFGSDMFLERGLATKQMSIDVPIGPDYILGAGDGLIINFWGGISQSLPRTIDREGKIVLPEAGAVSVAGLSIQQAQELVQQELSRQFRDAKVAITIARLRTIRVYVVGDVQRPGAYDISSLSTPLNALYAAGGPTGLGSLRLVRQYRGPKLIREVDLYDFLLRGVRPDTERIEDGDTILVSPVGRQVAVAGMVKRPAIYELKDESRLSDVVNDAGGLLVSAALTHITIERVE